MLHLLVLKSGIEARFKDIQFSRQGFIGYNIAVKQQEVLPLDAFAIVPMDKLYPDLWTEIERKVVEKVDEATKKSAESIVEMTVKMMEERLKKDAGNL
jgi:hypothetical protein